ncbi:MAG TPA: GNAT family N-acetyltransferase, partial [Thermomicrobiales bacterium]|nr:GNAT family N-acetyltransferase [Thermomicrobiales bacterium]
TPNAPMPSDPAAPGFHHPDTLPRLVREGERVDLREHQVANREAFIRWYGDDEIAEMLRHDLMPLAPARARNYFDSIILPQSSRGTCWAIHEHTTGRLIGMTAVTDIKPGDRSCLFRIVIGEKDTWGHGYGTEATALVADVVYEDLRLDRIRLEVFRHNERARRAYARVGFRETGQHSEWVTQFQRRLDVIEMELDLATPAGPGHSDARG